MRMMRSTDAHDRDCSGASHAGREAPCCASSTQRNRSSARYSITTTTDEILEFCKSKIAAYKYPRQLEIVDAVPKTVTGKFLRRVPRDREGSK